MDRMMTCPRCWGTRLEPGVLVCEACHRCDGRGSEPDRQLSPHFWLSELLESDTAIRNGIPNEPTEEHLVHLEELVVDILEPIRTRAGISLIISSGLRVDDLNSAIGGSETSAHREGSGADTKPGRRSHVSIPRLTELVIEAKVPLDQVILEPTWVHLGRRGPGGVVRGERLMMFRELVDGRLRSRYYPLDLQDPRVLSMTA